MVTEYAWQTSNCDPCPVPPLKPQHMLTLGGDVLFGSDQTTQKARINYTCPESADPKHAIPLQKHLRRYQTASELPPQAQTLVSAMADYLSRQHRLPGGCGNSLRPPTIR